MLQRKQRELSLFEVLSPGGHKLWPDWLRKIDTHSRTRAVIDVVAQALEHAGRRAGAVGGPGRQRRS